MIHFAVDANVMLWRMDENRDTIRSMFLLHPGSGRTSAGLVLPEVSLRSVKKRVLGRSFSNVVARMGPAHCRWADPGPCGAAPTNKDSRDVSISATNIWQYDSRKFAGPRGGDEDNDYHVRSPKGGVKGLAGIFLQLQRYPFDFIWGRGGIRCSREKDRRFFSLKNKFHNVITAICQESRPQHADNGRGDR